MRLSGITSDGFNRIARSISDQKGVDCINVVSNHDSWDCKLSWGKPFEVEVMVKNLSVPGNVEPESRTMGGCQKNTIQQCPFGGSPDDSLGGYCPHYEPDLVKAFNNIRKEGNS